jgi:hypothetical protein
LKNGGVQPPPLLVDEDEDEDEDEESSLLGMAEYVRIEFGLAGVVTVSGNTSNLSALSFAK